MSGCFPRAEFISITFLFYQTSVSATQAVAQDRHTESKANSRARAIKPLYQEAKAAEESWKLYIETKSDTSIPVRALLDHPHRVKARQALERVCIDDPRYALDKNVDHKLWMLHYRLIATEIQKLPSTASESSKGNSALVFRDTDRLRVVLGDCRSFYQTALRGLCLTLSRRYDEHAEAASRNSATIESDLMNAVRRLVSCFLSNIGDVERYEATFVHDADVADRDSPFASSAELYLRSFLVFPENGKPFNQMAVIAARLQNDFDAAYYYVRSLSSVLAFPSRENLITLLDTSRRGTAPVLDSLLKPPVPIEYGTGSRALYPRDVPCDETKQPDAYSLPRVSPDRELFLLKSKILRAVGSLITRTGLNQLDALLASCVSDLQSCLMMGQDCPLTPYFFVQVLVFGTYCFQSGSSLQPSTSSISTLAAHFLFAIFDPLLRVCASNDLLLLKFLNVVVVFLEWLFRFETAQDLPRQQVPMIAHPIRLDSLLHAQCEAADHFRVALARLLNFLTFEYPKSHCEPRVGIPLPQWMDNETAGAWRSLTDLKDRSFLADIETSPALLLVGFLPLQNGCSESDIRHALIAMPDLCIKRVQIMGNLLFFSPARSSFSAYPSRFQDEVAQPERHVGLEDDHKPYDPLFEYDTVNQLIDQASSPESMPLANIGSADATALDFVALGRESLHRRLTTTSEASSTDPVSGGFCLPSNVFLHVLTHLQKSQRLRVSSPKLVILDAPNICMAHGLQKLFSTKGLATAVRYWQQQECKVPCECPSPVWFVRLMWVLVQGSGFSSFILFKLRVCGFQNASRTGWRGCQCREDA